MKLVCRVNSEDTYSVEGSELLNFFEKTQIHYSLFNTGDLRRLYKLNNFFNLSALDLYYLSLAVFFADRRKLRNKTRDAWTRSFEIYLPVLEFDKLESQRELIENTISYLSGDNWTLHFRRRELSNKEKRIKKGVESARTKWTPKFISMMSGGLDSYIGAIDLLEKESEVIFVSHYGGGKGVKDYQDLVKSNLINSYEIDDSNFFSFHMAALDGTEDSTRSRSFMFFMHALIIASQIENNVEILIPENGLISLNIPFTNSRLGSNSTRTTHPFYLSSLNNIISNLDLKITLRNPYQFKTKGLMVYECSNQTLLKSTITSTMSCSHPDQGRYQGISKPIHCGTCLPCIIRRASILKGYGTDPTEYLDSNFTGDKASFTLRSLKTGILDFENSKDFAFLKISNSGNLNGYQKLYTNTYTEGMTEVKYLLDQYAG